MKPIKDNLAIQYALFRGIRSCAIFDPTNTVLGREYLSSKVEQDAVWQVAGKSGTVGVGNIIQIPTLRFPKPNSLQRDREYRIGIYEEPDSNMTPAVGTLRGADDWGDLMIDFLWNWKLWRSAGLKLQDSALIPDTRFAEAGIVGVQAVCILSQERRQQPRAATPQISDDGNQTVTLTATDGSAIYYTLDGFSTPAPDNDGSLPGEQAAIEYTEPFAVAAGTVVLAAAYHPDTDAVPLPSQTTESLIN